MTEHKSRPVEQTELLPCPFCGGEGEIVKNSYPPRNRFRHPSCTNTKCVAYVMEQDEQGGTHVDCLKDEDAIVQWNTRARPVADEGVSEGVCVFQDWLFDLTMQQQSVLVLACRGPDGIAKYHPVKEIVARYRATVLKAAYLGRPMRVDEGDDTTFMTLRYISDDAQWKVIEDAFFDHVDALAHHYYMHLMHGAQIAGYKHPDELMRRRWHGFYLRACHDLHLSPEACEQMDRRLGDWQRKFWDTPALSRLNSQPPSDASGDNARIELAAMLARWQRDLTHLEDLKARDDLTKDFGEQSLRHAKQVVEELTNLQKAMPSGPTMRHTISGSDAADDDDMPSQPPSALNVPEQVREALELVRDLGEGSLDEVPGAFDDSPPDWAKDPFNGDSAERCGRCHAWCSVVRPGKTQCEVCWDGRNFKYIAREALAMLAAWKVANGS